MNYVSCLKTEAKSRLILTPFLKENADDGALVFTDKGRLAKFLQETVGDVLFNSSGALYTVELKAEETTSKNLFLETWSNKNLYDKQSHADRGSNVGWMYKSRADLLFYHFLETNELYIADFYSLKKWCFLDNNIYKYREVKQRKNEQLNDTWGHIVNIEHLQNDLGKKFLKVSLPIVEAA